MKRLNFNKEKLKVVGVWILRHALIVIAFAALFTAITLLINLFIVEPAISNALIAAGTLTLSIAAFLTIRNSNE